MSAPTQAPEEPEASEDPPERADRTLLSVLLLAGLLRYIAVVGQQAIVYADSIDYERLDFWGGRRPWATPLLYELVEDHSARVLAQATIGALCWSFLAVQASRLVKDRYLRWAVLVAILALSLTTSVTNWDTTILSESLALSFGVLLLGALIRFWRLPTYAGAAAVVGTWLFWIFTRQAHLILGVLATLALAVALGVALRRSRALHRPLAALVAGAAVVTLLAGWSYQQDTDIAHLNLAEVIGRRVFRDADHVGWLHDHGMPIPEGLVPGEGVEPSVLLDDRDFARWVDEDGTLTYARFLLMHPWDTVTDPFEGMVSDRPPWLDLERGDEVILSMPDSYGVGREVIPEVVEDVLFEPGHAGTLVFGVLAVLAATLHRAASRGPDRRWAVPLVALLLQWPALVLVWHTSTVELGRLALPSAVLLRAALLAQAALLVDAWLADRRAPDEIVA
jgi:hypothetical protein